MPRKSHPSMPRGRSRLAPAGEVVQPHLPSDRAGVQEHRRPVASRHAPTKKTWIEKGKILPQAPKSRMKAIEAQNDAMAEKNEVYFHPFTFESSEAAGKHNRVKRALEHEVID